MPTKLHAAALALAARGIPVFPVLPGTKFPAIKAWQRDCTTDKTQVELWWTRWPDANIGIVPEKVGWCVIDVDNKAGKDGETTINELEKQNGLLPETLTIRTPSGGRHLYFRGSLKASQGDSGLGAGLDTRGRGSFVLAVPSTVAGNSYSVTRDVPIATLPEWVASALKQRETAPRSAQEDARIDSEAAVGQAREVLRRSPVPGPDGPGNDYVLFGRCKDIGVSEEKLLELCIERGSSPADSKWLEFTIGNAWRYGQNEPASDYRDPAERLQKHLPDHTYKRLLALDPGPVRELIPGLVERHRVAYLVGTGGMHKSRIAAHWGLAVHAGAKIYGRDTERAHFVHLSWENGEDEDARRGQKIAARIEADAAAIGNAVYRDLSDDPRPLVVVEGDSISPTPLWDEIAALLRSIPGHKFVVIDSLYNALRFVGNAKIDETMVKECINWLDIQCREYDFSGLMLQHPSRAGASQGHSGYSEAWNNAPRVRLNISKKPKSETFILEVSKRNNAIAGGRTMLKWADGILDMTSQVGTEEDWQEMVHEAAVGLAIECADGNHPLTKQGRIPRWMLDNLFDDMHQTVTARDILAACKLETMRKESRLVYHDQKRNTNIKPGYYPFPGPAAKGFD